MVESIPKSHKLLILDLESNITGEVLSDNISKAMYATDASLYQIMPIAIVLPKNEEDVVIAMAIARDHQVTVLPRGGGTSLAGQTVGRSLIIDFSKYLNKILAFNADEKWVTVEPGVILDQLNKFLYPQGLIFSPDPATSSRANIGGMVGNNSSGTKSILYGKTVDHVLKMKVLLSDGTIMEFSEMDNVDFESVAKVHNRQGQVYREVRQLIAENKDEIFKRFPKVMRRVSGYNLDEFVSEEPWNLSKLICGSEGTLAIILNVTLNLNRLPSKKSVCLAHFNDLIEALEAVQIAVKYKPAAVEILDNELLTLAHENIYTRTLLNILEGRPNNVLLIEFYGDTYEEIHELQRSMISELKSAELGYAFPVFDEGENYDKVWKLRKKGLGILLGRTTDAKPLPFIEDSAVPVESLPAYISEVIELCETYNVPAAMYAHASVGVIHVRPILNMRLQEDIEKMKLISQKTYELVVKYGGAWSGEHGDGLVRSYKNEEFFGSKLYQVFKDIKQIFDPLHLMNPGKIVDAQQMDENLRYGPDYSDQVVETIFKFEDLESFEKTVHLCSGVGECRKLTGTMCPSYHATMDEEHSTRGRANALRMVMSGETANGDLTDKRLLETLDLCLSCKACKSECPSNVDMAKLKSEVLQKKYDRGDISWREKFICGSAEMSEFFSGHLAPMANFGLKNTLFRAAIQKILQIDKRRILPYYVKESFVSWYQKNQSKLNHNREVVLFADTYLNYHEPQIGIAAYRLLESLGFSVVVADVGCCQRPKISNGFLRKAKNSGEILANKLRPYLDQGLNILVCEPSCTSALQDDLPDLIDDRDLAAKMKRLVVPIEQFVKNELSGSKLNLNCDQAIFHGHCHQKALYNTNDVIGLFEDQSITEIDSGCCGMAGSFGYEHEHYEVSKKIGEQRLFKAINNSKNKELIATGFSCRHQIEHFTGKRARHWVELIKIEGHK